MANTTIETLITENITKNAADDFITPTETRQVFNALNSYIQDTVGYGTAIPFDRVISIMTPHTITASITFTANTAGALGGCGTILRLTADGEHIPNFAAFKKSTFSNDFLNFVGAVNTVVFFFDGVDYFYSIFYMAIPTENKAAEWTHKIGVTTNADGEVVSWDEITGNPLLKWVSPADMLPPGYSQITGVDFGPDGLSAMQLATPLELATCTVYIKAYLNTGANEMLGNSAVSGFMLYDDEISLQTGPNALKTGGPWFVGRATGLGPREQINRYCWQWDGQRGGYVGAYTNNIKVIDRAAGAVTELLNPFGEVGWSLKDMQGETMPGTGEPNAAYIFKGRFYRIIIFNAIHTDAEVKQILPQL